jgi:hypothetical protein
MDTELLVEQIDDGRKVVEQLGRDGFETTAAFWVLEHGRSSWRLYIATPYVDDEGDTHDAYRRLILTLERVPSKWATIADVRLLTPHHPAVSAAVDIRDRDPDGKPVFYEGRRLGDMKIQGAYVHPEIAPARSFFIVQYDRVGQTNEWAVKRVEHQTDYENMRPRGAISYSDVEREGDPPGEAGGALVGVLVEIDPRFVPFPPRDRKGILEVATRQARAAADVMFKAHHPEAVVEAAGEHCLAP